MSISQYDAAAKADYAVELLITNQQIPIVSNASKPVESAENLALFITTLHKELTNYYKNSHSD